MQKVLDAMAKANRAPFHTLTPAQARAAYAAGADILEVPKCQLARVENFFMSARDGFRLPARLYAPSNHPLPTLLYFHGGGFVVGGLDTHDALCRQLSALSGCAVVSLDYRLAPEHKFPQAALDAWDALVWLSGHAASLGLEPSRLAVGGDSAGGTLAAQCAILAAEADLPLALQLLIYPGCAAHQDTASHRRFAHGLVLGQAQLTWLFNHYVRSVADRDDWRFSPINADSVDRVAPAWVGLAEFDPLVDEGIAYADKLRAAGVTVQLEIYRGVTHEFVKMGRVIPEARQAQRDAAQALAHAFNWRETNR